MNVLLIHSDSHRYDCLGSSGLRPCVHTPSLDRLASGGAAFTHAFSTSPVCTPARASLLTGAWPSAHGCFSIPSSELNRSARPELPVLTRLLADRGYRVAWTGEFHQELEHPPSREYGVEEFVGLSGYREFRQKHGIPPAMRPHGFFGDADLGCPPELSSPAWQADHVIRQIDERRGEPFFIRWDPPEPHLPYSPTRPFAELFAEANLPPWTSFPDSIDGKPAILRRQRRIWGVENWTWRDWLPVVRLYHSFVAELDRHIGRVLDHLDARGLSGETLVIYSTDHGDFCGGHGLMDKHFTMYDDILRVPLILRWPGRIPAGGRCDAFVSNSIDIARTILSAAGVDAPGSFAGQDLVSIINDPAAPRRPYAYSQYYGTESGACSVRMLRDRRHKFIYHPTGQRHEFYDLQADPGELRNLIDDPALAADIARFEHDLWDTMKASGDRLASIWTRMELQGTPSIAARLGMEK